MSDTGFKEKTSDRNIDLERFFEVGLHIMLVGDFDGYIRKVNPAWQEALGWSEAETIGRKWVEFIHPDDIERTNRTAEEVFKKVSTWEIDQRYRCKDGSYRWLRWRAVSYPGERMVYCVATDVTDSINSEQRLSESEQRFRDMADSINQMIWVTRPDGYHEYYNKRWYEYTGVPQGSTDGEAWNDMFHKDDQERAWARWRHSLNTGEPYEIEYRLRRADGLYRWVLGRAECVRDKDGNIVKWYGTCTDISDTIEREVFTRSILASSPDCIKVINLDGTLQSVNEGGLKQLEIEDASLCLNKPWPGLWPEEEQEKVRRAAAEATKGKTARFEGFCPTAKGTPKWWEVIVTPLMHATGETQQLLSISRDITERRHTEKKLAAALKEAEVAREIAEDANIAKSEFLANISHEIRTPMNAVIGLANILAISQPLTAKQKEFVSTLQLSADSLLGLINDLLDISKIEARTLELEEIPFSLGTLMEEVISMMSVRTKEKGLQFELIDESGFINKRRYIGDPTRMRQILLNLCSNAVKFTEKGGITLRTRCEKRSDGETETVVLTVEDTGIGIPADKLDAIFNKFTQADTTTTRKYGGTGLGLTITKTLAELMGGKVSVQSAPGKGSTFTVSLPLKVAEEKAEETCPLAANDSAPMSYDQGLPVLLVEDYAANIMVATLFLEQFGFTVEVATNGLEAIEKIKNGKFCLVLMDVQMHGMNGLEATQLIRQHEKQLGLDPLPIIGMTAHALAGDRERCIAAGMDDYVAKPFNPDELEAVLRQYSQHCLQPQAEVA